MVHIMSICIIDRCNILLLYVMELRDFFMIFKHHRMLGAVIILVFLLIGGLFLGMQDQTYKTSLQLNITRDHAQPTNMFTYDHFYRLQADERFADTLVQWVKSPALQAKIFVHNGHLTARRLSSQVVEVAFTTDTVKDAEMVSEKLVRSLNDMSEKLNQKQQHENWFVILGEAPVIADGRFSWQFVMLVSFFAGIFVAFWSVLLYHYCTDK